jgi:hypothetical protein
MPSSNLADKLMWALNLRFSHQILYRVREGAEKFLALQRKQRATGLKKCIYYIY